MMPRLDGFGLIARLRADRLLASTPVILLSARAGEEARIEGVAGGVDDYLTKPFSARELLARVEAHVRLARFRREIHRELRLSEARFRNMADHAPVMIWVTEADGSCSFLSRSWYLFTGLTPATGLGFGWLDAVHPDERVAAREAFMSASAEGRPFRLDYRLRRHDGEYVWVIDAAGPRLAEDGAFAGYIGSVIDITERKHAEQTQLLLVDELNHRVKNMLAVIQAIAAQTLRSSKEPAAFNASFNERIAALARAHGVLTNALWKSASLQDLLAAALVPFEAPGRIEIVLDAQFLSSGPASFTVTWRERDGPRVEQPTRKGFGSRLIDASAEQLGGTIALDYGPEGLVFSFSMPAKSIVPLAVV